jgi:hypothetical protein
LTIGIAINAAYRLRPTVVFNELPVSKKKPAPLPDVPDNETPPEVKTASFVAMLRQLGLAKPPVLGE